MARDDWYRNTDWNESVEAAFITKLSRARDKAQYLRLQAGGLAEKHPRVALKLLDQYFGLGEHWDHAQAHVVRATALLCLGDTEQAIESYEAALMYEEQRPSVLTQAYLRLPFVVAVHGIKARYKQALLILNQNKSRLTFPVEHFIWNTSYALIHLDLGNVPAAKEHARAALDAASKEQSDFRYHRSVGLVDSHYDNIREQLTDIASE